MKGINMEIEYEYILIDPQKEFPIEYLPDPVEFKERWGAR